MTYQLREFRGEGDLALIGELVAACQKVDHLDSPETQQALRNELLEPTAGWGRAIGLWESSEGLLSAFATVWMPPAGEIQDAYLWFIVHPSARQRDFVQTIISWGTDVGRQFASGPATLTVAAGDDDQWRLNIIPEFDFSIERYFLRMRRDLHEPLPTVTVPDGYAVRALAGPDELPAWVELFNHAFSDHWEHVNTTLEQRQLEIGRDNYRPHLDLVAIAPDGTFAGFCAGTVSRKDDGRLEPWIDLVGTHTEHRRKGIARAMIRVMFDKLLADGYDDVRLGVDAASPTNATSVYESLGFSVIRRTTVFRRPIAAEPVAQLVTAARSNAQGQDSTTK